jgi:hypothetical protein
MIVNGQAAAQADIMDHQILSQWNRQTSKVDAVEVSAAMDSLTSAEKKRVRLNRPFKLNQE